LGRSLKSAGIAARLISTAGPLQALSSSPLPALLVACLKYQFSLFQGGPSIPNKKSGRKFPKIWNYHFFYLSFKMSLREIKNVKSHPNKKPIR
jgi:hypothetical protein